MKKILVLLAALITVALTTTAEARHRHHRHYHRHAAVRTYIADPGCNVFFPCEGVVTSKRGEAIVKSMGGFGSARKHYTPVSNYGAPSPGPVGRAIATIVSHPSGCPSTAFCGCGAAVRVFGRPVRELWLAANWYKFPRTSPSPGKVAVRRHHVFVLEAHLSGDVWQVYDANSGGHATRIHARSISGYTIVDPHA